jgi:hypothetical protein
MALFSDLKAIRLAQRRFQQHADGEGQPADVAIAALFQGGEPIDDGFAAAGVEGVFCTEASKTSWRLFISTKLLPSFLGRSS